jgi:hypothetical protein
VQVYTSPFYLLHALTLNAFQPNIGSGLGAARHSGDGFRSDKYPTVVVERSLSVESLARQTFDQLAIGFENRAVGTREMRALGM